MAVNQGECPGCGAPIQFGVGSSIAKVCEFCGSTVVRSDHGLQDLGKVARIANTPSLVAVGDEGTLGGRPFKVMGRVQLDHGQGPWDEYYVAFDYGQAWGWLAYAQGHWYVTQPYPGLAIPPYHMLRLEADVVLGQASYRVTEIKTGTVVSAEGELPGPLRPQSQRYYADLYAPQNGFATLDYGENVGSYEVFVGYIFDEPQMLVTQLGPRSINKIKTDMIRCPNCGGDVPKLSGDRALRLGCPYCGSVSDIATQQVVAQQEAALKMPDIPVGSHGTLEGVQYVCIAYLRRGADFDGDYFSWEEYLIWSQGIGYRWLVKDPESGWSWAMPVNLADLDLSSMPSEVRWGGRNFRVRNRSSARVDYVLGEVYWKCEVGETTQTMDFVDGKDVLSREESSGEVKWSYSTPVAWPVLAQAFGLPVDGPGGQLAAAGSSQSGGGSSTTAWVVIVLVVVLIFCAIGALDSDEDDGSSSGGTYRGGGGVIFVGGK